MRVGEGNVIRQGFSDPELDRTEGRPASGCAGVSLRDLESRRSGKAYRHQELSRWATTRVFGYYIEASQSHRSTGQVPDDYVRRQTLANAERYVVPELKEYESSGAERQGAYRADGRGGSAYRRVCAGRLRKLQPRESAPSAHALAQVDVFRRVGASGKWTSGYVRPELDDGKRIWSFEEGRHPVVERVLPTGSYVPNDVRTQVRRGSDCWS